MNKLNFSAGPGILPESVLIEAQQAIINIKEVGLSLLGISHRSDWFAEIITETENNLRQLLNLPESHAILFLSGGASLQFTMIPLHFLRNSGKTAEYLRTGYWSNRSISDVHLEGSVRVIWDGTQYKFNRLPNLKELNCAPDAAYFHYVSNETVEGLQFKDILGLDEVIRICDMSSDFLSRPIDCNRFDLLYAHAQKNLGPAGVTLVIIRRALLNNLSIELPAMLDYRVHLAARSIYNTPPVFAIYIILLITRWLLKSIGGLENMAMINQQKANLIYQIIDQNSDFYRGHAEPSDRSQMNAVFFLPTLKLEKEFLQQAKHNHFSGLAGHRSLGGIRASLYNALTLEAARALAEFMQDFLDNNLKLK